MARKRPLVDLTRKRPEAPKTDLDSLFSADSAERTRIMSVAVLSVEPDPSQPRTVFDDESLSDLAASLELDGLIQPIEVVQIGRNQYRIVHGERRWRAASKNGWETIPAIVRQRDYDSVTKFVRQMVENIQREDLNDVDRAAGLVRLKDLMQEETIAGSDESKQTWRKTTWADVADRMGYSRQRVSQLTRLLQLPQEVQTSIIEGALSERDTRIFHGLTNRQQRALHRARVVDGVLSQAETKRTADYIKRGETQSVKDAIEAVQSGRDTIKKSDSELASEKNRRSISQLQKALGGISAETLPASEKSTLINDLKQIQRDVKTILDSLSK